MASQIDPTKPADAVPARKADLRANLQAAKTEIEALQGRSLPPGGDAGQVLKKQSTADYDAAWQVGFALAQDPSPQLGAPLDGDQHAIRRYRQRKYNDLAADQTLDPGSFDAGSTLVHAGGTATYTAASRLSPADTEVTEVLVIHNRGSGVVTLAAAAGLALVGDATVGPNASATLEWEHDGTTERVWARSTG